jgi:hypothetical protein
LKLHGARVPKLVLFAGAEEIPGGNLRDFYETSGAESFVEAGEELEVLLDVISRTVERGEVVLRDMTLAGLS